MHTLGIISICQQCKSATIKWTLVQTEHQHKAKLYISQYKEKTEQRNNSCNYMHEWGYEIESDLCKCKAFSSGHSFNFLLWSHILKISSGHSPSRHSAYRSQTCLVGTWEASRARLENGWPKHRLALWSRLEELCWAATATNQATHTRCREPWCFRGCCPR